MSEGTAVVLKAVVDECLSQVKLLEDVLIKTTPSERDSTVRRVIKKGSRLVHDTTV
jgi:hypothetical protein